jgi:hypothetical protein
MQIGMSWFRLTAVANGPRVECVSWYERATTPRKTDVRAARQRAARWALRLNDLDTSAIARLKEDSPEVIWY